MKIDWKRKLTSRKFWVAVIGVIAGIAAAFGIKGNEYAGIAGAVTSAASVVAYILSEAKVDAAAVSNAEKEEDVSTESAEVD